MHQPVLLQEVLDLLKVEDHKIYLDGTIGLGGHAEAILKRAPEAKVVGIDRDEDALKNIKKRLRKLLDKRLFLFHGNFKDFKRDKKMFPTDTFDGALLDLGVSSYQLDQSDRGFSFQKDGPLDMRMDDTGELTAADIVNTYDEAELARIFFEYGEERFSRKIARVIVNKRAKKLFETTLELSNLISSLTPLWTNRRIHPATRVFQALRIEVNKELEGLAQAFEDILYAIKPGGRLAIISFHSLEDRIVKKAFYRFENPCICPRDMPKCVCHKKPIGRRVVKKPITASQIELDMNRRSRSAKLRVMERVVI